MTLFDLGVLRRLKQSKLMSYKQIGIKKVKKGQSNVNCAKISILQFDFLEILKNSRTRNENFDKFFVPKEPEYNIFGPIPEHSKITVLLFI